GAAGGGHGTLHLKLPPDNPIHRGGFPFKQGPKKKRCVGGNAPLFRHAPETRGGSLVGGTQPGRRVPEDARSTARSRLCSGARAFLSCNAGCNRRTCAPGSQKGGADQCKGDGGGGLSSRSLSTASVGLG